MKWFRRRKPEDDAPTHVPSAQEAAERFWERWFELVPVVSAALGDGEPHRVEDELQELVAGLHPDLIFSLEQGHLAMYALVVTGQEDPRLRPYTDAWIAAAPPTDMVWEFHDSVPPVPDPTEVIVNLGGVKLRLGDYRVVAQVDGDVVDVAVYHPALAELTDQQRQTMTFLPLDVTLGERLAGERLRRVETAQLEPAGTISLLELRSLVRTLAEVSDD
ncbi:hypothetical protein ACIA8G_14465 [Lentzea sp. NPDC051213]|uniref:hypothetical protein n=1 Tax=Lentzea sp. NPDC051213 TaxID=3364126 RepID=UPI0037955564